MDRRRQFAARILAVFLAAGLAISSDAVSTAQTESPTSTAPTTTPAISQSLPSAPSTAGGAIHGSIKAGNVPLPGVSVTATNTLTGKKYNTTTDVTGAYSMTIPQNGRYVVRAELAAFA